MTALGACPACPCLSLSVLRLVVVVVVAVVKVEVVVVVEVVVAEVVVEVVVVVGVAAVIVKSFARIHETNLKKQGMLGLTFANESDYDLIQEDDTFNFTDLNAFAPGKQLTLEVVHADGSKDVIMLNHTYNQSQIEWYNEGSALNLIKKENA